MRFSAPVNVSAFVSVNVPDPACAKLSAPVPSCNTPPNVVLALSPPLVSVAAAPVSVTVPAPASEPMLLENPPRSSVAPLATVTAELEPKADVEPACSAPALTVVAPV